MAIFAAQFLTFFSSNFQKNAQTFLVLLTLSQTQAEGMVAWIPCLDRAVRLAEPPQIYLAVGAITVLIGISSVRASRQRGALESPI
jgi:hypothetical protein